MERYEIKTNGCEIFTARFNSKRRNHGRPWILLLWVHLRCAAMVHIPGERGGFFSGIFEIYTNQDYNKFY
jgi:hypothetical protein